MKPEKNMVRDLGWSVVGASIAIAVALWFVADGHSPFLLASLGGSTLLFLFALTESEATQPRALFGGHFGGALIGILAFRFLGDALWVMALAVVLTMAFMVLTRTIHPPAGANPLSAGRIPIVLQEKSRETSPNSGKERRTCHGEENIDACR